MIASILSATSKYILKDEYEITQTASACSVDFLRVPRFLPTRKVDRQGGLGQTQLKD